MKKISFRLIIWAICCGLFVPQQHLLARYTYGKKQEKSLTTYLIEGVVFGGICLGVGIWIGHKMKKSTLTYVPLCKWQKKEEKVIFNSESPLLRISFTGELRIEARRKNKSNKVSEAEKEYFLCQYNMSPEREEGYVLIFLNEYGFKEGEQVFLTLFYRPFNQGSYHYVFKQVALEVEEI